MPSRLPTLELALIVAFISLGALLSSQPAPRERVGPLPDGSFLLNSGWRLAPAGKQVPLDTFPMATALSPDGKYLLVLNGGYRPPSVSVIEAASARVVVERAGGGWLAGTRLLHPRATACMWAAGRARRCLNSASPAGS